MSNVFTATSDLEQRMIDHVEMVFSVAIQLTGNTHEAEKLTRVTIGQALRMPERFSAPGLVKKDLLTLLRRNFLRARKAQKFSMLLKIAGALQASESGDEFEEGDRDAWEKLAFAEGGVGVN